MKDAPRLVCFDVADNWYFTRMGVAQFDGA